MDHDRVDHPSLLRPLTARALSTFDRADLANLLVRVRQVLPLPAWESGGPLSGTLEQVYAECGEWVERLVGTRILDGWQDHTLGGGGLRLTLLIDCPGGMKNGTVEQHATQVEFTRLTWPPRRDHRWIEPHVPDVVLRDAAGEVILPLAAPLPVNDCWPTLWYLRELGLVPERCSLCYPDSDGTDD